MYQKSASSQFYAYNMPYVGKLSSEITLGKLEEKFEQPMTEK